MTTGSGHTELSVTKDVLLFIMQPGCHDAQRRLIELMDKKHFRRTKEELQHL